MDGIINFNKPIGVTSAKALYKVRSIVRERKSGHAGTLDPAATGVLVLCLGRATKLVERVMDQPKAYRTTARLDVTSESFDSDRPLQPVAVRSVPTIDQLQSALRSFEGVIEQVPPAISAVKVGGVPAYKRAGGHAPLELKARTVRIYWLHLHAYAFPTIDIEMCCGRGTYVRSLIRDLGVQLETGGCLTSLVRLRVGPFSVDDAWTLDSLAAAESSSYLVGIDSAIATLASRDTLIPPRPE